MEKAYKLCFLGYRQLTQLAENVIRNLNYTDTEIYLRDCNVETLPSVVDDALGKGCEVFIAGSGNAAAFVRYSHAHLCEIAIRDMDYLLAIKKALKIGSRPAIVTYRFSKDVNIELLSELSGCTVGTIVYEDSAELSALIQSSDCDVIIGASYACECAGEVGKKSVLAYAGEETIRRTIIRARNQAIELRKEQRYHEINRAIIREAPLGIIVSDETGRISLMNQIAQNYIGVPAGLARGRLLSEIASNLSPDQLMKGDDQQIEVYKILNGVRVQCIQNKLRVKAHDIGVLTTLHIDNRSKKRYSAAAGTMAAVRWKEIPAESEGMRSTVALGKKYAYGELPLAIYAESGVDTERFAECIHTGGPRSQQPLLSINLSAISANDAGRHLLGSEDRASLHTGLLETANNGTVILRNLENANAAVQDCLFDVINRKQLVRIGGYEPVPVNIRFIALFKVPLDEGAVRSDLLCKLCTLRIDYPPLRMCQADIPELFNRAVVRAYDRPFDINAYARAKETLCCYGWPRNMAELNTVADRLTAQLLETPRFTPRVVHRMMIEAIGEERLFEDIACQHPGIGTDALPLETQREAIERLKYFLGYNNAVLAEKLGMSRTSLWRMIRE